jgi:hypothetical protein
MRMTNSIARSCADMWPTQMKDSPKQHKHIRAVYPNGGDKRGYRVVFAMPNAEPFTLPYWLAKAGDNIAPQRLSA